MLSRELIKKRRKLSLPVSSLPPPGTRRERLLARRQSISERLPFGIKRQKKAKPNKPKQDARTKHRAAKPEQPGIEWHRCQLQIPAVSLGKAHEQPQQRAQLPAELSLIFNHLPPNDTTLTRGHVFVGQRADANCTVQHPVEFTRVSIAAAAETSSFTATVEPAGACAARVPAARRPVPRIVHRPVGHS